MRATINPDPDGDRCNAIDALDHTAPWRVIADGNRTDGQVIIGEAKLPPRTSGPSLHVHEREDEGTYVIDGSLTFSDSGSPHLVRRQRL